MSNLVLNVFKNDTFDFCLENLPEEYYGFIFAAKDNDTADILRDRMLIKVQEGLKNNLPKISDSPFVKKYLTSNSLQDVIINAAEAQIEKKNGKYSLLIEKMLGTPEQLAAKPNPRIEKQLAYLKFKSNFNVLLDRLANELKAEKLNEARIKETFEKLDNYEKVFLQAFSDLNASIILLDKPDNLLMLYGVRLFKLKLEYTRKTDKSPEAYKNLAGELKQFLQKNMGFTNMRLKKLEERVTMMHGKVTQGTAKTMNPSLISGLQNYLKIYTETSKLDMAFNKAPETETQNLIKTSIQKLAQLAQSVNNILEKIPVDLKKDLRNFLLLNEEFLRLYSRMFYLKKLQAGVEENNTASFTEILKIIAVNSSSLYLYRADGITYREIRNFIDQSSKNNKAVIFTNSKVGSGIAFYTVSDAISFIGEVKINVLKEDSIIKLTFTGNCSEENYGFAYGSISYLFNDSDDAAKFIISGFKEYDFFERLQDLIPFSSIN